MISARTLNEADLCLVEIDNQDPLVTKLIEHIRALQYELDCKDIELAERDMEIEILASTREQ